MHKFLPKRKRGFIEVSSEKRCYQNTTGSLANFAYSNPNKEGIEKLGLTLRPYVQLAWLVLFIEDILVTPTRPKPDLEYTEAQTFYYPERPRVCHFRVDLESVDGAIKVLPHSGIHSFEMNKEIDTERRGPACSQHEPTNFINHLQRGASDVVNSSYSS